MENAPLQVPCSFVKWRFVQGRPLWRLPHQPGSPHCGGTLFSAFAALMQVEQRIHPSALCRLNLSSSGDLRRGPLSCVGAGLSWRSGNAPVGLNLSSGPLQEQHRAQGLDIIQPGFRHLQQLLQGVTRSAPQRPHQSSQGVAAFHIDQRLLQQPVQKGQVFMNVHFSNAHNLKTLG